MFLATCVTDGMAMAIIGMLYLSGLHDSSSDKGQRVFRWMLLCATFIIIFDISGWWMDGMRFPGSLVIQKSLNTLLWAGQIVCSFLWFLYTRLWLHGEKQNPLSPLVYVPLGVFAALLTSNWFSGSIFSFDAAHIYHRGIYYLPVTVLVGAYSDVAAVMTICRFFTVKDSAAKKDCLWMSAFMLLPYLGMLVQLFVFGISLITPAYALSFLMIYLNIHQKRMVAERLKLMQQAADLQRANIAIMLSQIQPHFLYNALCVIQDLCHGKAPEAEEATIAFSRFLRGNLDSLKSDKTISFTQELSHTRYYLTLEQMRFGERLHVVYDIRTEMFRVPALTLQPIVENAVRYGVMKRPEGGTVRITAEETFTHFRITVTDDGVGFDPLTTQDDGRTHIGISNVRQRLREMCGGDLVIESIPNRGTTVTIMLPNGGDHHEHSGSGR